MNDMGRVMIIVGIFLIAAGVLFVFMERIPGFGKLPGDVFIKKENFSFYFPITTGIIISLIITIISHLWPRK